MTTRKVLGLLFAAGTVGGVGYLHVTGVHHDLAKAVHPAAEVTPVLSMVVSTSLAALALLPFLPKAAILLAFLPPLIYGFVHCAVLGTYGILPQKLMQFLSIMVGWIAFAYANENYIRPWLRTPDIQKWFGGPLRPAAVAGMRMDRAIKEHEAAPHRKQLDYYKNKREEARAKVVQIEKKLALLDEEIAAMGKDAAPDLIAAKKSNREDTAERLGELRNLVDVYSVQCNEISTRISEILNLENWNTKWR